MSCHIWPPQSLIYWMSSRPSLYWTKVRPTLWPWLCGTILMGLYMSEHRGRCNWMRSGADIDMERKGRRNSRGRKDVSEGKDSRSLSHSSLMATVSLFCYCFHAPIETVCLLEYRNDKREWYKGDGEKKEESILPLNSSIINISCSLFCSYALLFCVCVSVMYVFKAMSLVKEHASQCFFGDEKKVEWRRRLCGREDLTTPRVSCPEFWHQGMIALADYFYFSIHVAVGRLSSCNTVHNGMHSSQHHITPVQIRYNPYNNCQIQRLTNT